MHTNGLGYLLGLLCVVSDIALGDLDSVLSELSVPVSSCDPSTKQSIPSRGAARSATRGWKGCGAAGKQIV
jgi:hypothetical protein